MQTVLEKIDRLGKVKAILFSLTFIILLLSVIWLGYRRAQAQFVQQSLFLPVVQGNFDTPTTAPEPTPPPPPEDTEPEAVAGEYVILWKPGVSFDKTAAFRADEQLPETPVIELLNIGQMTRRGEGKLAEEILEGYRNDPNVLAIEPNYIYTIDAVPNDPDLGTQYAWDVTNAYAAWDVTEGSSEVVIAIIDTGIQTNHPDLDSKIVPGYNFVRANSNANDDNGHGTHVAGTAAAETNNGGGGAGLCPNCRLMPIKVLASNGSGSLADVAQGIIFAADNGADIINMSLGGASSTTLRNAIDYAWSKGAFVTCAAGNNSSSRIYYPAGYDNCISVASTTANDQRSNFSNYGTWVDIAAPGSNIYSTYITSRYANLSGTSMAAPHVAGLAGLLASQGLSNDQIRETLCNSADNIAGTGSAWRCGRINAAAALNAAPPAQPTNPPPPPPPTPIATPPINSTPPGTNPSPNEPTPMPSPTPMVEPPAPNPSPPDSALQNGNFEQGDASWTPSTTGLINDERPRSGSFAATLGGELNSSEWIEQVVTVPENGRLSYYWFADGQNDMGDRIRLEITVLDANARYSLSMNATNGHWYHRTVTLSGLAGRQVRLRFTGSNNGFYPTTFYIDDITLR